MKIYQFLCFCCLSFTAIGQVNKPLNKKLDSLFVLYQKYCGYLSEISENSKLADSLMAVLTIKENLTNTF